MSFCFLRKITIAPSQALALICVFFTNIYSFNFAQANWENYELTKVQKAKYAQAQQTAFQIKQYKETKRYLDQLNRQHKSGNIKGLELLVAAPTNASIESKFGHSLIRFVSPTNPSGRDIVLGLVADVNTPKISYLKGIFGGYAVYPVLNSLRDTHLNYVKNQNRQIDRYIIQTDQILLDSLILKINKYLKKYHDYQKKFLKRDLLKIFKKAHKIYSKEHVSPIVDPSSGLIIGYAGEKNNKLDFFEVVKFETYNEKKWKYTFFKRNCAGALNSLFEEIGLKFSGISYLKRAVPKLQPLFYYKNKLIHFEKKTIPGINSLVGHIEKVTNLNLAKKHSSKFNDEEVYQITKHLSELSKRDLMLIYDLYDLNENFRIKIISEISSRPGATPRYDEFYQINTSKLDYYRICTNVKCLKKLIISNEQLDLYPGASKYTLRFHHWSTKLNLMDSFITNYYK